MKKYFPLLLSKAGELKALSNLSPEVKSLVTPVLQVLPETSEKIIKFSEEWNFNTNELFLDFSLFQPFVRTTASQLITTLISNDVGVVPVLQENSHPRYYHLIQDLINDKKIKKLCVRFTATHGGFMNINAFIASLVTAFGIARSQISILIDFGFVTSTSHIMTAMIAATVIESISNRNDFEHVIIASGSFPDNLGSLNPPGRVYRLQRYEWNLWLTLQTQIGIKDTIKYSDYGTKHPYFTEANFQGSCSIKYTGELDFVIYRGEKSGNHIDGNGQYITFSQQLIASTDYSGVRFSWGDGRINTIAAQVLTDPRKKPGNSGSWVEISQNHHITLLASLL